MVAAQDLKQRVNDQYQRHADQADHQKMQLLVAEILLIGVI